MAISFEKEIVKITNNIIRGLSILSPGYVHELHRYCKCFSSPEWHFTKSLSKVAFADKAFCALCYMSLCMFYSTCESVGARSMWGESDISII